MKKIISIVALLALVVTSCSSDKSLNRYLAEKSSQEGFMSITIPASILHLKEGASDQESKDAVASLKRINVLVLRNIDSMKVDYNQELAEVEAIIAKEELNEMMSMNLEGYYVTLNFKGSEQDISEVIAFGKGKQGFALARITGENITAEKLFKVASSVDLNNSNLKELSNLNFE